MLRHCSDVEYRQVGVERFDLIAHGADKPRRIAGSAHHDTNAEKRNGLVEIGRQVSEDARRLRIPEPLGLGVAHHSDYLVNLLAVIRLQSAAGSPEPNIRCAISLLMKAECILWSRPVKSRPLMTGMPTVSKYRDPTMNKGQAHLAAGPPTSV